MTYEFNKIPHFFKEVRKRLGYTQGELAKLLEIDRAYLSRIETGKAEPSLRLIRLADDLQKSAQPDHKETSKSTSSESPVSYNKDIETERAEVLQMVDQLFDRLQELKDKEGDTGRASRIEDVLLIFKPFIKTEEGNADIPPYIRTVLKTHVPPEILEKLNL